MKFPARFAAKDLSHAFFCKTEAPWKNGYFKKEPNRLLTALYDARVQKLL